ncbi:hypothetical protein QTN25_006384 [Entamoeba marina]
MSHCVCNNSFLNHISNDHLTVSLPNNQLLHQNDEIILQIFYLIGLLNQSCTFTIDLIHSTQTTLNYPIIKQICIDDDTTQCIDLEQFILQEFNSIQHDSIDNETTHNIQIQLLQTILKFQNDYLIDLASLLDVEFDNSERITVVNFDYFQEIKLIEDFTEDEFNKLRKGHLVYEYFIALKQNFINRNDFQISSILSMTH